MNKPKIILGVDPGTNISGYGIIKVEGNKMLPVDYGSIKLSAKLKISDRYLLIFKGISTLVEKFKPDALVIETQFVAKNPQSAIKLGMARGVALIAAKKEGISVFEYSPATLKKAVTGLGSATKYQIQSMVMKLLNLSVLPEPEDAADALALAICHAHSLRFRELQEEI